MGNFLPNTRKETQIKAMADDSHLRWQMTKDAEKIYDYHRMHMPLSKTSAGDDTCIFCLCSLDLRVARRAAQLYLDGHGRHVIFSGGTGKLTAGRPEFRDAPEAVVFARIATEMGVPAESIMVESRSANTGENVRLTYALLREKGMLARRHQQDHGEDGAKRGAEECLVRSFILVQKPYMERRTYATFMKQWPGMDAEGAEARQFEFVVTSPQLSFAEYPDDDNPRDLVINIMVGDLVRIRTYPAMGYQIPQDIPEDVWEAGQRLIAAGFNEHLP